MLKTIGITALITLATFSSQAVEIVDRNTDSTSGKKMHICGVGVMSGLNVNKNRLLCNVVVREMPGFDDYSTSRFGMHACPLGTAMLGIHVNDDVLKCTLVTGRELLTYTEYVDSRTSSPNREGMHSCPEDWVMTGIHVNDNKFLCTQLGD